MVRDDGVKEVRNMELEKKKETKQITLWQAFVCLATFSRRGPLEIGLPLRP